MSGIEYLLDTNFILALLKSKPETLTLIEERRIQVDQCGYSAITRMELLGFPGMTVNEELTIQEKLAQLIYLPIHKQVEDEAIRIRRAYRIKLPDAIIAATALVAQAEVLTFDRQLQRIVAQEAVSHPARSE